VTIAERALAAVAIVLIGLKSYRKALNLAGIEENSVLNQRRIIDLTSLLEGQGVSWPGAPFPEVNRAGVLAKDGYNVEVVKFTTHTGTHIDAPAHMLEGVPSIDQLPIDGFVGEAVVLDFRHKKPGEVIAAADLSMFDSKVRSDDIVLFCTGWGPKRDFTKEFLFDFPGLDASAAKWIVDKKVRAVGIDTLGIDPYSDQNFTSHKVLFAGIKNFWIAEGLTNLEKLLDKERWLVAALPLKIKGASGAEARVVAMEL
jgi:arylformamidase